MDEKKPIRIEIRPYGPGQYGWGLWINDRWCYGNPEGPTDGNSVAHIICVHLRDVGIDATYQMIVPPERYHKQRFSFWRWLSAKLYSLKGASKWTKRS